jgi:D-sedoheptulose 7-phosphate isomerase/D-glycero-D-manno-heptose 1,7-bisphosphate phosphatase
MSMWCIGRARREPVPGILLDRDGTIIEDYHYVGHTERVQLKPGAAEAIRRFNEAGIPVAVVTNQSGVARGFFEIGLVEKVHQYIARELALHGAHIDLFLYSPHHPDGNIPEYIRDTPFHKPAPGMALQAAAALGLDLKQSWVVGDRHEDMTMAGRIGAHAVYVGRDRLRKPPGSKPASFNHFPSLADAAGFIIERITGVSQSEFPTVNYPTMLSYFGDYSLGIRDVLNNIGLAPISKTAEVLARACDAGSAIFIAGNGGAASLANHFETDLVKHLGQSGQGWFTNVCSLCGNTSLITQIANDIGYDSIFSYQLERKARTGDVLIVFTVSGNSANIVRALNRASELCMITIAIVAGDGGKAAHIAGTTIHIPSSNYGVAEDIMSIIMHSMAQFIRQSRMSDTEIRSARF